MSKSLNLLRLAGVLTEGTFHNARVYGNEMVLFTDTRTCGVEIAEARNTANGERGCYTISFFNGRNNERLSTVPWTGHSVGLLPLCQKVLSMEGQQILSKIQGKDKKEIKSLLGLNDECTSSNQL